MDNVEKSLARIEGQIRGIARMYRTEKKCLDIVQQVAAAKEALNRVGRELLRAEACQMVAGRSEKAKLEKVLKRLFKS